MPGPISALMRKGTIHAIAYFQDDTCLLTAGHDGHITQWDVKTGERLRSVHAHLESVQGLHLTASRAVLTSGDHLAKLWVWPQEGER